jgi:carboxyl-terminal processing protease
MTRIRAILVWLAIGWLATGWLALGTPLMADQPAPNSDESQASEKKQLADYYELLRLFVDTLDQVERNYVEDVSRRELLEAAIDGMLSKLDQHSDYIAPEDMDRFKTGVESEFGGIGIHVSKHPGSRDSLRIISPLVGSPAYRAGIMAGDVITHVMGEPTRDLNLDDAVRKMKGPIGTPVRITVRRAADGASKELELLREVVRVDTVLGDERNDDDSWNFLYDDSTKVGYIRVTGFARRTTNDLRAAIRQLREKDVKGLILDLRNNPGGLLSTAIQVSDIFVASGLIVRTEGRNTKPQSWDAGKGDLFEEGPMVILVNRGSASASEIVAACLQDHGRAVIIGERTFGKGSVQNIIELEEGRSALKLTTAGYIRPSGMNIHRFPNDDEDDEWGVRPDDGFEVKVSRAERKRLNEIRRARDIVGHKAVDDSDQGTENDEAAYDRVLEKALAYLHETSDEAVAADSDEE